MASDRWFISDTHFGHEKTCTQFLNSDGSFLRPFSCAEEMDEQMVQRWNERVKPGDKVYVLGDVVIAKKHLQTVQRLNGKKRLIRGNHDIFDTKDYVAVGFKEIYGARHMDIGEYTMMLTHIPIHSECVSRFKFNIHGHLHANVLHDQRYINVCVEKIGYAPIHFDELAQIMKERDVEEYSVLL